MKADTLLFALALLLLGCDATPSRPQPSVIPGSALPTHRNLGGGPAALLTATLIEDGGCVYATTESPAGRWLPIWPSGYRRDGQAIKEGNNVVASVSAVAKLGGGEYHASQLDFLRTLLESPIPVSCQASEYWLVTEVVP